MHFVFPGSVPAGLPIEVMDEEPLVGRTALTGVVKVDEAIVRESYERYLVNC